jgi:hypothetical protein
MLNNIIRKMFKNHYNNHFGTLINYLKIKTFLFIYYKNINNNNI